MKLAKKITIVMLILLGSIIISGNVEASHFQTRVLRENEIILKSSGSVTTGNSSTSQTARLTSQEQAWWNTLANGGSVSLSRAEVEAWQNIFCISSSTTMPKTHATYSKSGEEKRRNDDVAYILSEPRKGETGDLYRQTIQGALWRTNFNLSRNDGMEHANGGDLYNAAVKFMEYRNTYKEPQVIETQERTDSRRIVGPFKINYTMTYYGGTRFGSVEGATLRDQNGNAVDSSLWGFRNADGSALTNNVGGVAYNYPLPNQEFYIFIDRSVIISKANLTFQFNNLEATGHAIKMNGTYYSQGGSGNMTLCSKHRKQLEAANCGDTIDGVHYAGYKAKSTSVSAYCGKNYKYIICEDNKELEKTQYAGRKRVAIYRRVSYYIRGSSGYTRKSRLQYFYCNPGQSVNVQEVYYRWNKDTGTYKQYYVGTSTVRAGCNGGYCGGGYIGKKTAYELVPCTPSDPCSNCAPIYAAAANCGEEIKGAYVDKSGEVHESNAHCGTISNYPPGNRTAQPLCVAYGERTVTPTYLNMEFNVECVDIALRKFITALNDKSITNRVPQVDTSPLRNGQTTAIYNHTKEVVGVKIGDIVTYTIRVYNEGTADGYAKEIKDYLPTHLEYVSSVVDGVDYKWRVTTENGKTVLTTTYLEDRKLEKYSEATENGMVYRDELDYAEVKVICRVKDGAVANEKIVNISEVSKYAYYDKNTQEVFYITSDTDSTQNNINLPTSEANWQNYYGSGSNGNYVRGQEDDDDFERLAILYTDMGGTVWLDAIEGKQEERDGILTDKDQKLQGVTVRLYIAEDLNTIIAETTTDANGNYLFTKATINGVTQNIPVNETYMITFEYGGQQYIPVQVTRLNSGNYTREKSAGEERETERNSLNAKFYEIVKGTAKNSSGGNTVELSYTRDNQKHTSTIIRDESFYEQTKILARTEGNFSGTADYVKFINLGLIERPQVNLGIMTDVQKVDLTINGYNATYDYSQRDEGTAINIEAKAADISRVYNQAIYKSDYNYRITDYNEDGKPVRTDEESELEVYITYKIKIKNYSSEQATVSELTSYYAQEYNLVDSWYEKGSQSGSITWTEGSITNGYKTIRTNNLKQINIGANEDVYVYIQYQVTKDENGGVILGEKYHITEITGYTTSQGLIDKNSEPGNIDISSWDRYVETYEDDTDRAPGLNLHLAEAERTMIGYVWEDITHDNYVDSDGVKIGDGVKNGNEQNKNGVRVQLIELVTIDGHEYEYIWQEVFSGDKTVSYMDRNGKLHENSKEVEVGTGEYKFIQFVPGKYIVRFIYGDTQRSIELNGQDYKSTTYTGYGENTSSAKDNKDRRLAVMNYSIKQTNELGEILAGNNESELIENTWMYADTVEAMTIQIKDTSPGHNVNFGLVKRPISKLVAIKEVTGIKISNKGIIYVDTANGITSGINMTDGKKWVIELDDELINGAQLEVSYNIRIENQGEKDTLYNYFEGESKYGNNQHEIITTRAEMVYDYPEKLGFDEDSTINPSWTKEGIDTTILKQDAQNRIANGALVIKATEKLFQDLKPGESTQTVTMTLSKIMSVGGSDDLSYDNNVEIVSRINGVGRRDEASIPGNYVPHDGPTEPDTGEATVTITDPTGQNKVYYGLAITVGIIVAIGIVLIQKKILRKK